MVDIVEKSNNLDSEILLLETMKSIIRSEKIKNRKLYDTVIANINN